MYGWHTVSDLNVTGKQQGNLHVYMKLNRGDLEMNTT